MEINYIGLLTPVVVALLWALGLLGCVLPFPGALFTLAGSALLLQTSDTPCPWWVWLILGLFTLAHFFIDTLTTYLGAKRFQASKQAIWCSVIGLVIGAFFFPLGLVIGPFLGAFLAELIWQRSKLKQCYRSGLGALLGSLTGILAKIFLAIPMMVIPFCV